MDDDDGSPYVRVRIANACDVCKARKVKCSGETPCGYCNKRGRPQYCRYTPQQRRRPRPRTIETRTRSGGSTYSSPPGSSTASVRLSGAAQTPGPAPPTLSQRPSNASQEIVVAPTPRQRRARSSRTGLAVEPPESHLGVSDGGSTLADDHEEAEVPREARLLRDAQGKLIFIGDCAPLSFFQTARQLVTSRVDPHAFAPETSRYTVLQNASFSGFPVASASQDAPPPVQVEIIDMAVRAYFAITTGLVELFDRVHLTNDITNWATDLHSGVNMVPTDNMISAVYYLVLAIGLQKMDDKTAHLYFDYARHQAFTDLSGNLSVGTVQIFILVTVYMLSACQINGAFLFFGIADRAAYSVGLHRTEVNSRFGPEIGRQRDSLWKSLRVVDLFLSTSMGRPPASSDMDCTVSYFGADSTEIDGSDMLNASAQIFTVIERIALEVYSRRKISLQLTEGISRELRDWSNRWLQRLKDTVASGASGDEALLNGACQVLSTYYYAVILVARPFLMYELHRRLADGHTSTSLTRNGAVSGRSKLADACIDAASLMVDPIQHLITKGQMSHRSPLVVSWLFASSLVLGLGLLGGFGRILERHCRNSIAALEFFAEQDTHAMQYSLIANSLLSTALQHLDKVEAQERLRRTESSSQLFGLLPREAGMGSSLDTPGRMGGFPPMATPLGGAAHGNTEAGGKLDDEHPHTTSGAHSPRFSFDLDSTFMGPGDQLPRSPEFDFLAGALDAESPQVLGALNLFPLLETGGHIDLAHFYS